MPVHAALDLDAIALLQLIAVGGRSAPRRALLDAHASPAAALAAGTSAWRAAGLDTKQVTTLRAGLNGNPLHRPVHQHIQDWLAKPDCRLIGWHDPDYPPPLRSMSSPPLALFVVGDPTLLWRPAVAVVGSRAPTAGGREHAFEFAQALARAGLVVVSGLASGVDAAAHRAALALPAGATVAVLGCGPDIAYPRSHRVLLKDIGQRGAVASEHPPGTGAQREFFPSRNRILAGLTLGTLVVEAGARSGALITARLAADAGREVFAIPGSIRNPLTRGCHRLIRDGAQLVEHPQDVVEVLAPLATAQAAQLRALLPAGLETQTSAAPAAATSATDSHRYRRLWQVLGHDPSPMDQLVQRSGLTAAELSSMLLVMELEGRVVVEHGRYARK